VGLPALKNPKGNYSFVTRWSFKEPLEQVWGALYDSDRWPTWWRGVEQGEKLRSADAPNEVGSVRRFTWKSRLPYRLTFDMTVTRVEPMSLIESTAEGELEGEGRWSFSSDAGNTLVRYDWSVCTTKAWMNVIAPVARPVFQWNHDVIMEWGREGLIRLLGQP